MQCMLLWEKLPNCWTHKSTKRNISWLCQVCNGIYLWYVCVYVFLFVLFIQSECPNVYESKSLWRMWHWVNKIHWVWMEFKNWVVISSVCIKFTSDLRQIICKHTVFMQVSLCRVIGIFPLCWNLRFIAHEVSISVKNTQAICN